MMWTNTLLRAQPRASQIIISSATSTLQHASRRPTSRGVSTLSTNPHIYIHPHPTHPQSHILSLLPTSPPTPRLSLGTTTALPPTPASLLENPSFLLLLRSVLAAHAASDPAVRAQAMALAVPASVVSGSATGVFSAQEKRRREKHGADQEGASGQGGAGGAGRGGWVHVSDERKAVDFGRIAEPEDIFGSVEVAPDGGFVKGDDGKEGNFQWSGTYRIVTREGILGLSDFLREKLVERLKAEEAKERKS